MSMILGMTASAASAHKHEFSNPGPYDPEAMNQEQQPFLHPLQYLQGRLHALTTAYTSALSPSTPTGSHHVQSESHIGQESVRSSLETCSSSGNEGPAATAPESSKPVARPSTTKTSYLLSHPAPRTRGPRILNKNRMLLQLRKITHDRSPAPALEVFPGSAFPRSVSKRLSHTLKDHHTLNSADLVILNCQSYHPGPKEEDTGDSLDEQQVDLSHREVVGCIHTGEGDAGEAETEISIGTSHWSVSRFERGRYEFKGTDDEGNEVIARWWIKNSSRRSRRTSTMSTGEVGVDRKFNFSILRTGTRRHPIVGRMDQTSIEVNDHFTVPDSPSTSKVTSPAAEGFSPLSFGDGSSRSYFTNAYPAPNTTVDTSADLRKLILVTGIWVAVAEGWSMAVSAHFETRCPTAQPLSTSNPSSLRIRATSAKTVSTDVRADTPQSTASARSRIPSWPHRHSASTTTPDSPNPHGSFPHRSNTISALTGSMRRRSGFFRKDTNGPASIDDDSHPQPRSRTTTSESLDDGHLPTTTESSVVSPSQDNVHISSDISSINGHNETGEGLRGMAKQSKSKSGKVGKRERFLGLIHRKSKA